MALSDYLADRRRAIEAEMKALKAELAEIRIAEEALLGVPTRRPIGVIASTAVTVREGSIKDWVLKALALGPNGMETDDIIATAKTIGGPDIPRSSITPQLSRLKAAGLIELDGRAWRLPERKSAEAQKNETSGGSYPPDVFEDDPHGVA